MVNVCVNIKNGKEVKILATLLGYVYTFLTESDCVFAVGAVFKSTVNIINSSTLHISIPIYSNKYYVISVIKKD